MSTHEATTQQPLLLATDLKNTTGEEGLFGAGNAWSKRWTAFRLPLNAVKRWRWWGSLAAASRRSVVC